jgi:hypothetical protein
MKVDGRRIHKKKVTICFLKEAHIWFKESYPDIKSFPDLLNVVQIGAC